MRDDDIADIVGDGRHSDELPQRQSGEDVSLNHFIRQRDDLGQRDGAEEHKGTDADDGCLHLQ